MDLIKSTNGALYIADETNTLIKNGVSVKFPGRGVVDDKGNFRKMTEDETKKTNLARELREEALAAHSPISLRPCATGEKLVCFGLYASTALKNTDSKYEPGSVKEVDPSELKLNPFVSHGIINDMHIEDKDGVDVGRIGFQGRFRLSLAGRIHSHFI